MINVKILQGISLASQRFNMTDISDRNEGRTKKSLLVRSHNYQFEEQIKLSDNISVNTSEEICFNKG